MSRPSHLTCRQIVELVTDYLESALDGEQTTLFEEHMNFCDGCAWYLEQMRAAIAGAGLIEDEIPPEAREHLLTAFRQWRRT